MNRRCHAFTVGSAVVGLLAVSGTPLAGQHPIDGTEFTIQPLRPHGQPVVPLFEGWWQNADGTYNLCFSYMSLNLEEVRDIQHGPDNFMEPSEFDGSQPTHFMSIPTEGVMYRRQFCPFTINVPEDFGDQRIVWTLRNRGVTLTVPGHLGSQSYILEEPESPARGKVAPVIKFMEPPGPEGRGRRQDIHAGPLTVATTATVGDPLRLTVSVTHPEGGEGPQGSWWVAWSKHQGPVGEVTFNPQEIIVGEDGRTATTTATFSEPGDYVLRVTSIDEPREIDFQCCWTSGYVRVAVVGRQ